MLQLTGRELAPPLIIDGYGALQTNKYASRFRAVAPPSYAVRWGIWCYVRDGSQQMLDDFKYEVVKSAMQHWLRFKNDPESGAEHWERKAWWERWQGWHV